MTEQANLRQAQRRHLLQLLAVMAGAGLASPAFALSLSDLTNADASQGIKAALTQGAQVAVAQLGTSGGFFNNPQLRIPLPGYMGEAAKMMRRFGQGRYVDEVEQGINRAAELAVPMGKDVLLDAVQRMTLDDAKRVLSGGDHSVTSFFMDKTRQPLAQRFLPVVTQATGQVGVVQQYNQLVAKASSFGVSSDVLDLNQYVTGKTLDGLYAVIAEQERAIRQNPLGSASAAVRKVFGSLR
ncbi:hypothetical protein M2375_000675 [Comamonas sp. BIGb0152]|uniref:DUF4197 domain-containing protein n=1 Tax=Comamonas sp. BIGb0152 TaxID=2940601 RepID=UPI002169163C|nr:DUF4197 domain-containing protein [Comamonas sp. BIGb0152]MCS4292480.1 hypothetical protein [Comamonas sp. BIGb0152]